MSYRDAAIALFVASSSVGVVVFVAVCVFVGVKELLNKAIDRQRKVVEHHEATGENDEGYNATLYLRWLIELRDLRAEIDRLENEKS